MFLLKGRPRSVPSRVTGIVLPGLCVVLAGLLVVDSPLAMQGARDGLALCGQVVIPSLYPFFVLSGLFAQLSGARRREGRGRAMRTLLRQPSGAAGVVLMGLLGGYPMGAKTAAQFYERGLLTRGQAQRLQLFCVNAGPAYLIGAVGTGLLGSRRAGAILFISMAAASLLIGLCTRFLASREDTCVVPAIRDEKKSFDQLLLTAVGQATGSILGVCAWIVLFSTLCALLRRLPVGLWGAIPVLNVFLEVSSGAQAAVRAGVALPVLCAALGWGGLSVHCQLLGDIRKTGLPLQLFWASRLLHGGMAAALCHQLLKWFPVDIAASIVDAARLEGAAATSVKLWAVSAPAAAAALFFCAFLILDLDLNRKIC